MNNYDETIYCDADNQIVSPIKHTSIDTNLINIYKPTDKDIEYQITRYTDKFYYYKNDTIIGQSIRHYGEYTQLEIELLRNFIKSHHCVYDVGANIGYHTLAFSKLAKHIYAFEPNKKNLKLLHKNLKSLDNVKVYDMACSDTNCELTIEDFDTSVPGNYGEMHTNVTGQTCTSVRIDDLDDIYGPDLIKIDVEGHELQVLKGATETIKEFNPIIFYEAHGTDLPEIYDFLTDLGYHLYWYPCPNYNPGNYKRNPVNLFGHGGVVNILAMPKSAKIINNLVNVIDRNDTIQLAFARVQKQ